MIDSPLLQPVAGYIGGRWASAAKGQTFAVVNPASGERLADVPAMTDVEATSAIEAASASLEIETTPADRKSWLDALAALLHDHKAELARVITVEQGKPLRESEAEVAYAASFFEFFAEQLHHLSSEDLPSRPRGLRWQVHHRAAGVVALITPWNFPLAMLAKKLAPALAAGCSAVVKPAEQTPLTAIALFNLLDRVSLPSGRANLVLGEPAPIGEVLCTHPEVRLISFTGSTDVGKHLIGKTAPHIKRLTLELGGNAPFIVLADADLGAAADALMANKFRCAGQTCVCANRVYVQASVAEAFADAMGRRVGALRVGNGLDDTTDVGPLINRAGFEKVARHVNEALSSGARRVVGEQPDVPEADWGAFYSPTVLTGVTDEMAITQEETFGPVVAISTFQDEAEVVQSANATQYGLAAYLFSRDTARAEALIRRLMFGHVGLNTGSGPAAPAPFGGMKQSGFGREGGIEGLMEFCETQVVVQP